MASDSLALFVRERFTRASADRKEHEDAWIKDLRQYKGVYDPEIESQIEKGRSKAYIRLTRTKVKAMDARVFDALFPGGEEKNYSIDPTPVPEMDEAAKSEIAQIAQGMDQLNEEELEKVIEQVAKGRAQKMAKEIDDQLLDIKYADICRDVIHSGHLYGTGVLKGPLVESRTKRKWTKASGVHAIAEERINRPFAEHVSIWDIYPDLSARDLSECEFIIQRHRMLRHQVRALGKVGFDKAVINDHLKDNRDPELKAESYEGIVESINISQTNAKNNKYELLEYWGAVDGYSLKDCGCEIADDQLDMEYEANVWTLGDKVIKVKLNPFEHQERPFHFYYFEKDELSVFGLGIPRVYRDPQMLFNASIRLAIDNAARSAHPIVEVNGRMLRDGEDPRAAFSGRVYVTDVQGNEASHPAVRVSMVDSHTRELLQLADLFKQLGDEATTIPSYTHGEQDNGVAKTVGGLSMLMGATNITLKDVARNFDNGITKPFIRQMNDWNMQFSDKEEIKGDYQINALGSTSLVAKEVRANQLSQFNQSTQNQFDAPFIKRVELLRKRAESLDLRPGDIIKSDEEIKLEADLAQQQQQAALMQQQGMPPGMQ